MLNRLKKNDKKGFTLVELIVVLVILAILAALLIPALTGYIDRAQKKQIEAETRQAVMAAQTIADELYAKGISSITEGTTDGATPPTITFSGAEIEKLAELPTGSVKTGTTDLTVDSKGMLTKLVHTRGSLTCTYAKANATTQATFTTTP